MKIKIRQYFLPERSPKDIQVEIPDILKEKYEQLEQVGCFIITEQISEDRVLQAILHAKGTFISAVAFDSDITDIMAHVESLIDRFDINNFNIWHNSRM